MIKLGSNGIGKIYLGSNSIGKAYLGSNLVYTSGGSPTPPTPPPTPGTYVTDGLILHMDGIDKGNTEGKWTSLVGGYEFTNYRAVFNANNVEFSTSNNTFLDNTDFVVPMATVGTIEFCYETSDTARTMRMFYPGSSNGAGRLAFGFYYTGGVEKAIWVYNSPNYSMYVPFTTKGTISINNNIAICNSSAMTSSGTDYWIGGSTANKIGQDFNGKIYSIRIYDRQLTQAEILTNQAVDNTRFSLGL